MVLSNKTYDILKWVQRLLFPALATFYLALGSIWTGVMNLPYPEQVAATITAIDALLGVLLGISQTNYNNNPVIGQKKNGEDGY